MKKLIVASIVAVSTMSPFAAGAHEGHTHKLLGTVASVRNPHVEVKGTDGKIVLIMLDAKTAITRGKAKADTAALKVGERVSVEYVEEKKMNMAKTIKLGEAPAPAKP